MLIPIGKIDEERDVDFAAFPENVQQHVIFYGLKQLLNDCHSDVTEKLFPDASLRAVEVRAAVAEKLAALESGDIRVRNGGSRDPIKARMISIAFRHVPKIKGLDGKVDVKAMRASVDKLLAKKGPLYRDLAVSQIEAEKALGQYVPEEDEIEE